MSIYHKPSLPSEVLTDIDIENQVAWNILVTNKIINVIIIISNSRTNFGIYFLIESPQRVSPFFVSAYSASWTVLGIYIPYLWVRCQYLYLTFWSIALRFFRKYGIH